MPHKVAVLLDGGFVRKKIQSSTKRFPTVADIQGVVEGIMNQSRLSGAELFRVFYYDAPPLGGTTTNPLNKSIINFYQTRQAMQSRALIDALELQPDFAVRRGELIQSGWKLGKTALKVLSAAPRVLTGADIVPNIDQKAVDMKIGLDIATLSIKRLVDVVVLVTGDSDFVPALKFARREGLKVYLEVMGHPVRRELRAHADVMF